MKFGSYSTLWGDNDGMILIDRNEEMLNAARKLSDFINTLNLPVDQHNQLVELMIEQVLTAERNAFLRVADWGWSMADTRRNTQNKADWQHHRRMVDADRRH